jgi:cyclophilin family peptidyl-prolyl cis-trans isomerase/HEAT repeat protein
MADARRLDTALVHRALRSEASAERAVAALIVGQVHGRAMAGDLRALLADRDTAVAANAAYALGLLRDTASADALARALGAARPVAIEAAWALGQIGAPAATQITRALGEAGHAPDVLGALLLATAKLRPVPVAAVVSYLKHANADVRWSAAYAIARPYAAAGVRALLPLASDSSALVRAEVARALARRAAGDSLAREALFALEVFARDPDAHVRVNAIRSLGGYGNSARASVLAAVHDPDANVRVTAAQTLGQVLDSASTEWMRAWHADTGFMFRKSLMASAMEVDRVLPAAGTDVDDPDTWFHMGDWRYRAAVAEAGARAPSMERMREVSLPAVRDPDGRVRYAGYAAIAPHADTAQQHPWRREFMYLGLEDWDTYVRMISIESLTGHANAAEVPRVLASYRFAQRDTVYDARRAAVRFFASAWRRDSAAFPDSVIAALRALPAPDDPLVREAGEGVSLFSAWRNAPPTSVRPIAWYEERVRTLVLPALAGRLPRAEIQTVRGPITLELFALDAPLTVDNFLTLTRRGYYRNLTFHRVVPNFVAQDGDRRGDGNGGPPYTIRDELNRRRYHRGAVGMALSGPDTGGSQYFITLSPQPHLDGGYTVFGRVVSGMAAVDALVQGDSIRAIVAR